LSHVSLSGLAREAECQPTGRFILYSGRSRARAFAAELVERRVSAASRRHWLPNRRPRRYRSFLRPSRGPESGTQL